MQMTSQRVPVVYCKWLHFTYLLLANVNSRSRSLYAIARPSFVCLSVTFVRPTRAVQIFGNISTALGTLAIHSSHGNPSAGELNTRGVGQPSIAISNLSTAISRKRRNIVGKLLLISNRKSYMSFRLLPKSVTLNDLERRNGVILRYFSELGQLSGALRKSSHSLSHLLMSSCKYSTSVNPWLKEYFSRSNPASLFERHQSNVFYCFTIQ